MKNFTTKAKKAHEGRRKPGNMALRVPVRRPSAFAVYIFFLSFFSYPII
jgi:hypothetical protein